MDSSGIGLILGRQRCARTLGGTLRIQHAPEALRRVLQLANIPCVGGESGETNMKAENSTKIQFDSLSVNEAFARGAAAAFLARYDPTVPQLADIKTAVSEAVTNCIVHAYPDRSALWCLRWPYIGAVVRITVADQRHWHPGYPQGHGTTFYHRQPGGALRPGVRGHAELYG